MANELDTKPGTTGAPVENIALTPEVIQLLGAEKVAELQNKIKAAADSRETLENIIPEFTAAVKSFTDMCNTYVQQKQLEAESDKFDEISESKALAQLAALPDDNPQKQATIKKLLGEYGAREIEIVLEGNQFQKNLLRPLKPGHKHADQISDLRKGWDYFMLLAATYANGVKEAPGTGVWAGDNVRVNAEVAKIALERLESQDCPGIDMVKQAVEKALSTGAAGSGAEWLPTLMSNDLITEVWAALRMAPLFQRYTMSSKTLDIPTQNGNTRAYIMDEAISDTARGNTQPFWQNFATPSGVGSGKVSFLARKLAVLSFYSDEVDQDAVLPILDIIRRNIVEWGLASSLEDALLNGTYGLTTADLRKYMDNAAADNANKLWSEGDGPYDARAFIDGLRFSFFKQGTTPVDGNPATTWKAEGLDMMRNARKSMGKWGATSEEQNQLVWFAGLATHIELLKLDQVVTMDKIGARATILSGQIGSLDGIPFVLTQFMPTNLNNLGCFSNGVATTYNSDNGAWLDGQTSNTAADKTAMLLVNRRVFAWGDRQSVRIESERQPLNGQRYVLATTRMDGKRVHTATEPLIAMIRNMAV